ncbi:MAG: ribonuclease P protein component [Polyangiaceae bacterium]|nr:ribonuclease P protein component [Polyangiaceae bacterium]
MSGRESAPEPRTSAAPAPAPPADRRARRVCKRSEYQRIQRAARRVSTPSCALLLHAREAPFESAPSRLGIVASRKVGGSVQRNRAKRLVREAFRATPELWPPGADVVFILRRVPAGLAALVDELRRAGGAIARRWEDARRDRARRPAADRAGAGAPPGTDADCAPCPRPPASRRS